MDVEKRTFHEHPQGPWGGWGTTFLLSVMVVWHGIQMADGEGPGSELQAVTEIRKHFIRTKVGALEEWCVKPGPSKTLLDQGGGGAVELRRYHY